MEAGHWRWSAEWPGFDSCSIPDERFSPRDSELQIEEGLRGGQGQEFSLMRTLDFMGSSCRGDY